MSLIQFTKENPELVDVFKDLKNGNANKKDAAIQKLLTALKSKPSCPPIPPSSSSSTSSSSSSSSSSSGVGGDAATATATAAAAAAADVEVDNDNDVAIVDDKKKRKKKKKQKSSDAGDGDTIKTSEDNIMVKFTLQRLFRGLTSTKHQQRISHANALTQVLIHCPWINTSYVLSLLNDFCEREQVKDAQVQHSLLIIRNLIVLIFLRTNRIYDINHDTLMNILLSISHSRQSGELSDLTIQVMLAMIDLLEEHAVENATEKMKQWVKVWRTDMKYYHNIWRYASRLIPTPLSTLRMLTSSQLRLLLRMYYYDQIGNKNQEIDHDKVDNILTLIDDQHDTIHSLGNKMDLVLEMLYGYLVRLEEEQNQLITNLITDKKMWLSFLELYCGPTDQKGVRYAQCAQKIFKLVNQRLLKRKLASVLAVLIDCFSSFAINHEIGLDDTFQYVIVTDAGRLVSKLSDEYRMYVHSKEKPPYWMQIQDCHNLMTKLTSWSTHEKYGKQLSSKLLSLATKRPETTKKDSGAQLKTTIDTSKLKMIHSFMATFWNHNQHVHSKKNRPARILDATEKEMLQTEDNVSDMVIKYLCEVKAPKPKGLTKNSKNKKESSKMTRSNAVLKWEEEKEWLKEALQFFVRIVALKHSHDIFNTVRFDRILQKAKSLLRVILQLCWNTLSDSRSAPLKRYILQECLDVSALLNQSTDADLRYRTEPPPSKELIKTIETLLKDINNYNWLDELCENGKDTLMNIVYVLRFYAYTMDAVFVQDTMSIIRSFIDDMQANQGKDEEQSIILSVKMNLLLKQCFQSCEPLLCCVGRETFLAFASHFGNQAFEYLIDTIAKPMLEVEEENKDEEMEEKDQNTNGTESTVKDSTNKEDAEKEDEEDDSDSLGGALIDYADSGDDKAEIEPKNKTNKKKKSKKEEEHEDEDEDDDEINDDALALLNEDITEEQQETEPLKNLGLKGLKDIRLDIDTGEDDGDEMEALDHELMEIFRAKKLQKKASIAARKKRTETRIFHILLLFVRRYPDHPMTLILLVPLLEHLWGLFKRVQRTELHKAKKKAEKAGRARPNDIDKKHIPKILQSSLYTKSGIPRWRFDSELKKKIDHVISNQNSKSKNSKKKRNKIYFDQATEVIELIVYKNKANVLANNPRVEVSWLQPLIEDIVKVIEKAPTPEHEMLGVNVLTAVSRVYASKFLDINNLPQLTELVNEVCLWTRFKAKVKNSEKKEETAQSQETTVLKNNYKYISDELLWLLDFWFAQLVYYLTQPANTWYFSRDFFIDLIKRQNMIGWKMIQQGFKAFKEICKSPWAQLQMFLLLGEATIHMDAIPVKKRVLEDMATLIIEPLSTMFTADIDPDKRSQCAQKCAMFQRRAKANGIKNDSTKKISTILTEGAKEWKGWIYESDKTDTNDGNKTQQKSTKSNTNTAKKLKHKAAKKANRKTAKKSNQKTAKKSNNKSTNSAKKTYQKGTKQNKKSNDSVKKTNQNKKRNFSKFNSSKKKTNYGAPPHKKRKAVDNKFL